MDKIKFLHIMTNPSVFHNGSIIKMINEREELFNKDEHKFYVYHEKVFEEYKYFGNVFYVDGDIHNTKIFCKLAEECDNVFLHWNCFNPLLVLSIPKRIWKKVIWVEWGTDIEDGRDLQEPLFKHIVRILFNPFADRRLKNIRAIGIGNYMDALLVRKRFGDDMKIARCAIHRKKDKDEYEEKFEKVIEETPKNKATRVMVGYSSYANQNHLEMLKKLSAYKDENIIVSLMFAHGDMKRIPKYVDYAKEVFKDKLEILNRMDEYDFLKYINSCDVVLLNQKGQLGLGTIAYLCWFKKKIYMRSDSYTRSLFDINSLYSYDINDVGKIPFEEFKNYDIPLDKNRNYAKERFFGDEYFEMWAKTLKDVERKYI